MTDSIPSRAFVPNEADLYARIQALPDAYFFSYHLVEQRFLGDRQPQAQLTFLGIPFIATGTASRTAPRVLVEKEQVLKALGTTDFVRAAFVLNSGEIRKAQGGPALVHALQHLRITSQLVGGTLFVRRADLLQALDQRPPAPARARARAHRFGPFTGPIRRDQRKTGAGDRGAGDPVQGIPGFTQRDGYSGQGVARWPHPVKYT